MNIYKKDWCWSSKLWPPEWRANSLEKIQVLGKVEGRRRKVWKRTRWLNKHHWLIGYEFEQTLGDCGEQISLVCYSPWDHKESDTTSWLHNNSISYVLLFFCKLIWLNQDSNKIPISKVSLLVGAYCQYFLSLCTSFSFSARLFCLLPFIIYCGAGARYMRGFSYPKMNRISIYDIKLWDLAASKDVSSY